MHKYFINKCNKAGVINKLYNNNKEIVFEIASTSSHRKIQIKGFSAWIQALPLSGFPQNPPFMLQVPVRV